MQPGTIISFGINKGPSHLILFYLISSHQCVFVDVLRRTSRGGAERGAPGCAAVVLGHQRRVVDRDPPGGRRRRDVHTPRVRAASGRHDDDDDDDDGRSNVKY